MRAVLLLLAFTFWSFSGQAQSNRPTAEQRAQAMTLSMTQHLKLSGAQAAKVREINLTSIQMMEQSRNELKNDPRQLQVTMERISATRLTALKEVLTPTQFTQFNAHRERKMGVSTGAGPSGGGNRPAAEEYSN